MFVDYLHQGPTATLVFRDRGLNLYFRCDAHRNVLPELEGTDNARFAPITGPFDASVAACDHARCDVCVRDLGAAHWVVVQTFKEGGKYADTVIYATTCLELFEIFGEARDLMREGKFNYTHAVIDVPSHPNRHPHMIPFGAKAA